MHACSTFIDFTVILTYRVHQFQLTYKQEGDDEKVTIAIKILSMTTEEVEEALSFVSKVFVFVYI